MTKLQLGHALVLEAPLPSGRQREGARPVSPRRRSGASQTHASPSWSLGTRERKACAIYGYRCATVPGEGRAGSSDPAAPTFFIFQLACQTRCGRLRQGKEHYQKAGVRRFGCAGLDETFLALVCELLPLNLMHLYMKTSKLISTILVGWSCVGFCFSAASQDTAKNDQATDKRVEFFQQHFAKFVPVQFRKAKNSDAEIQLLHVKESMFEYEGAYYCGFKFTVPEWLDGDFGWMWLLAKTEANKDFATTPGTFSWYIIPATGRSEGFASFQHLEVSEYAKLKERFPHSAMVTAQTLDKDRLKPGKTYGIWFGFKDKNLPDIAVSMTIRSERGEKEFGVLPLR